MWQVLDAGSEEEEQLDEDDEHDDTDRGGQGIIGPTTILEWGVADEKALADALLEATEQVSSEDLLSRPIVRLYFWSSVIELPTMLIADWFDSIWRPAL